MNKYVVVVESSEAISGYDNAVMTKEGDKFLVTKDTDGWVDASSSRWGGNINESNGFPIHAKMFDTQQAAIKFATRWKGHPWWCKPNGNFVVLEVSPKYEQKLVGYQVTGPACSLRYDMDTGRMIEVTMEEL